VEAQEQPGVQRGKRQRPLRAYRVPRCAPKPNKRPYRLIYETAISVPKRTRRCVFGQALPSPLGSLDLRSSLERVQPYPRGAGGPRQGSCPGAMAPGRSRCSSRLMSRISSALRTRASAAGQATTPEGRESQVADRRHAKSLGLSRIGKSQDSHVDQAQHDGCRLRSFSAKHLWAEAGV